MTQRRTSIRTRSMFEILDPRCLMAADVVVDSTIPANPQAGPVYLKVTEETRASDVNLDGVINHFDAHSVMNFLNSRGQSSQSGEGEADLPETDVNGDGETGPLDVMWIVSQIKQYDPLTPCDCASCSQPTIEARCENASIAQTQSANLMLTPAGESTNNSFESPIAAQPIEDILGKRK